METVPEKLRQVILGKYTSRQNKLWIVTGWKHFKQWHIEWKWAGDYMRSRMLFQFELNGPWIQALSFEEDILPKLKYGKEK